MTGKVIRMPQPPQKKKSPFGSAVIVEGPDGSPGLGHAEAQAADYAGGEPQAAGAPAQQPPGAQQLAEDMEAAAAQLRMAAGKVVAVAGPADAAPLLNTYQSLLSDLASLRQRLEGASDADLLDIGRDFQTTVQAVQVFMTESGRAVGSSLALSPRRAPFRWKWIMIATVAGVVVGGGYWLWKNRKKRAPKLAGTKRLKSDD